MGDLRGQILPLLARIDATLTATLPTLATKAELAPLGSELRDEIGTLRTAVTAETGALRTAIARLPRRGEIWTALTLLIAAYAAGLADLALLK